MDENPYYLTFTVNNNSSQDIYAMAYIFRLSKIDNKPATEYIHFRNEPIKKGTTAEIDWENVWRTDLKDLFKQKWVDTIDIIIFKQKEDMEQYEFGGIKSTADRVYSFTKDSALEGRKLTVNYP